MCFGNSYSSLSSAVWKRSLHCWAAYLRESASQPQRGKLACPHLARVVQRLDNTINWLNHDPVDSVVCFANTYPLDIDLSGG